MYKKYILLALIFMGASALGMQNRDGKRNDMSTNLGQGTTTQMVQSSTIEGKEGLKAVQIPSCSPEQLLCLGATLEAIRCFVCGL